MLPKTFSQRGQALILIVLGIVGLVAITALAIDAGNAFSDRRHAQNTADTAALAAALAKIQAQSQSPALTPAQIQTALQNAAISRATSNSYNNDGVNTVMVNNPPVAGCNGTNGPYAGNDEYIQVIIHSTVNTFFAPIVGINQLNNCVEAIAKAKPSVTTIQLAYGAAVAALSRTDPQAIKAIGNADVTLLESGAFSNSIDLQAIYVQKAGNLKIPLDKRLCAVGGISVPPGYLPPVTPPCDLLQLPYPLPDYMLPKYTCLPDYNYNDFPPTQSDANVTWTAGVAILNPGVYCISGSLLKSNISGTGVTIVMLNQGLAWSGNVSVNLSAPTEGPTKGLVIYLPYGNKEGISFKGTAGLNITGTIFAPDSEISLAGDFGTSALISQWIGNTVYLGGDFKATIQYPSVPPEYHPPTIELAK